MPVTWQSNGTISSANAGVTLAPGKPTGLAAGDYMLCGITSADIFTTTPTGWTLVAFVQDSLNRELEVWGKIADSSDVAASNFSFPISGVSSTAACVHRFSGQHASTPLSVTPTTNTHAADTNQIAASITPGHDDCLLVCFWAINGTDEIFTAPGSMTMRFDMSGLSTSRDYAMATEQITGGLGSPTGTRTATVPSTKMSRSITIALRTAGDLFTLGVSGGATPSGSLVNKSKNIMVAALTLAGALAQKIARNFTASTTPGGSNTNRFVSIKIFLGTLSSSGILTRKSLKNLTSTTASSGTVIPKIIRIFGGLVTPVGTIKKKIYRRFLGSVAPTGTLWKYITLKFLFHRKFEFKLDSNTSNFELIDNSNTFVLDESGLYLDEI